MQRQCRRRLPPLALAAASAAVLAALYAGCSRPRPASVANTGPRHSGVTLRVAVPDGPAKVLLQRHGRAWERDAGAALTLTAPDDPKADVHIFLAPELAGHVEAGRLRPLTSDAAPDEEPRGLAGLLPLYRNRLLRWGGPAYALPLLGDSVLLCVYRADQYREAATAAAFREKYGRPLAAPAAWEDVADQAAFFTGRTGKPSLPPLPADVAGLDRLFGAVAAPSAVRAVPEDEFRHAKPEEFRTRAGAVLSFQYDADAGRPNVADAGFVEALQLLQRLQPHRAKAGDRVAALKSGDAVLGVITLAELASLRGAGSEARWGVCRVPGRRRDPKGPINVVPYVGSGAWLGAVAKTSANADAALDLLATLSGEAVSLEVVHQPAYGSGPFRRGHLTERAIGWANYGLGEDQTRGLQELLLESADPRIVNPAVVLRVPGQEAYRQALVEAVRNVLTEGGDAAAALAAAAKKWQALDGGPEKAKAVYRKSLGL